MHVWGISVDLDSIAPFLITAFLIVYGLVCVVKNTASKYFVVDASFEGGGGVESSAENRDDNESESGMVAVGPEAMEEDRVCFVCGQIGTKRCSLCKAFRYCTAKCQREHWNSGHKKDCRKIAPSNDDQNSNGKKQLKKVLFYYDEFVKLYNWNNPGFPPCGLLNCGNSCFANVVLQCLTYTKPLIAYLLEKGHQRECKKTEWCFLCEFQTHVERASRNMLAFSPVNILSRLPHIGGNLGFGNQEDAHEFMRFAIDSMQSVFVDQFGGEKALHPSSQETTLIQYIFGGHLLSQVKCTTCFKVSNRYESMMDLAVEIHGDNASLEECLYQFTTPEWLDGDNKYKCDGCDAYVMARKRLSIQQPPNILTVALKRFQGGRFGKLNNRVTFPETLDLGPYMTNSVEGTDVYNLYAVVVHIDMLNASYFGHYICYVKDFRGDWYRIDDSKVVSADLYEVLSSAAYMLLYCRDSPRESAQMPAEPSKLPEPVEKLESCPTSFQIVATSASANASSSWGVHVPVKPFSACDYGDLQTKDEETSKYIFWEPKNGRTYGISPLNGMVVSDNGHSNQGSCVETVQQAALNNHKRSDSGCSSSTDIDLLSNGNGHHNQGSIVSFENELNAQSPSSNIQGFPEEDLNDVSDPMEISDRAGLADKENEDQEQTEKRPTKRKKEIGADSGLSDVCITDGSKQRKKDRYEGLFRRGFLNENGDKVKKKVNKSQTDPPPGESMFKNGNCCSSIVDAACSADSSSKEKLGSDIEEMLCADVKENMNMSTCARKISDQEVTISHWPSCSPDLSYERKCRAGNDELPCNGNYFSAECVKDIQIDMEETPSSPKAEHSSANGSPEAMCDDSNTVRVSNGYRPSSDGKFCPDGEESVSLSNSSSSSGGKFCPEVGNNGL